MKATEAEKDLRKAVHIAAVVMQAAGLCRYEDFESCKRLNPSEDVCVKCIEHWLIDKARWERKRPAGQ